MGNNSKENAVPAGGLSTAQHKYDNTNIVAGTSYIKPEDFDPVDFMKKITGFQDGKYMGFACKSEKYGMIRTNSTVLDLQNSLSEEPSLLNNNFLFCASLLREEKQGQRKDNCVCTGSIIVDMDYGTEGHRKASFFATEEDALNCLRTLPIKPSLVWNTGHGLQGAFFLLEAVFYSDKDKAEKLELAKRYIYSATHSDSTQSNEHLFRFPGSMNIKPDCPPVRGRIIEAGSETYSLDEIISKFSPCFPDGLPEKVYSSSASNANFTTDWREHEGDIESLDEISVPDWLEKLIEAQDVNDASAHFFSVCIALFKLGCTLECIASAVEDIPWLPERYKDRLTTEVERCLTKYDPERGFSIMEPVDCIGSSAEITDIPLSEAEELSGDYLNTLKRYCDRVKIAIDEKMLSCCRFQEHIYNNYPQAQIALGCGMSKTTHAIVHVAGHAGPENKFVIVVQSRTTIFELARSLESLGITAGIYVGFNKKECDDLTKKEYTFEQCLRGHKDSMCRKCNKTAQCLFYQSDYAFDQDVVLITHESFIIQVEKGRDFSQHTIIIDEELKLFSTEEFTAAELAQLRTVFQDSQFKEIRNLITDIFPDLKLKTSGIIRKTYSLGSDDSIRHIRLNNVITSDILRTLFRFSFSRACPEKYHALFFRFLLFIRTAVQCGASIAYTVSEDNKLVIKKQRLDFRAFCEYRKLFILNASAHLSVVSFPDTMPTLGCTDLDKYSKELVRLHIVIASPTKSRIAKNTEAGLELFNEFADEVEDTDKLLLSYNPGQEDHCEKVCKHLEQFMKICMSSSGYLRSTNAYKNCSAAFFASTGFFTSIGDCALTVCLSEERDINWERFMRLSGDTPTPLMDKNGRFCDPAMQETYARTCLDLLYQAIYRTQARCGKDVDIFLAVPSLDWLVALSQIMKCSVVSARGANKRCGDTFVGMSKLVNMPPGESLTKHDAASLCGYTSWKQAKRVLREIIAKLFEFSTDTLTRKPEEVH